MNVEHSLKFGFESPTVPEYETEINNINLFFKCSLIVEDMYVCGCGWSSSTIRRRTISYEKILPGFIPHGLDEIKDKRKLFLESKIK